MYLLYIVFITESLHRVFVNNQPLNSLTFESSLFSGLLFLVMVSKGDKQGASENGLMQIYVKQWKLLKEWRSMRKTGAFVGFAHSDTFDCTGYIVELPLL